MKKYTLLCALVFVATTASAATPNPNCLPTDTPALNIQPNQSICINVPAHINMITCKAVHLSSFFDQGHTLAVQQNYYGSAVIPASRFQQSISEDQQDFHFTGTTSSDLQTLSFNLEAQAKGDKTPLTLRCQYYR